MTSPEIVKARKETFTLIKVVETIHGVSLKGCFLELSRLKSFVEEEDYKSALDFVMETQETIGSFNPAPDIVQIFDRLKQNLLVIILFAEKDCQGELVYIILDIYAEANLNSRAFKVAVSQDVYEDKENGLKLVIDSLKETPFKGSEMLITLINLIRKSTNRAMPYHKLLVES
jgi:hypothetical protein